MPAINSGTVLVTGASGFLGTYVVQELLQRGFKVRAVVRDTKKGEYLKQNWPGTEYVIVEEMNAPGAYDSVVEGVDGVIHVASPLDVGNTGHPDLVIEPAVVGVENLLKAVSDKCPTLKRFVQISSIAAIAGLPDGTPKRYTEEVWNDADVDKCYELGAPAPGPLKYIASKTKAERAFWKWFEQDRKFDAVAILPGMILGPPKEYGSDKNIGGTNAWVAAYAGQENYGPEFEFWSTVDVREVAHATVSALSVPEASGERFIVAAAPLTGNDVALIAEDYFPSAPKGNKDPEFQKKQKENATVFDGSKATRILGTQYRPKEDTVRSLFEVVKQRQ